MQNYRLLNLPKYPFRDKSFTDDSRSSNWISASQNPNAHPFAILPCNILSDHILDRFKTYNLEPIHCVMFCRLNKAADQNHRVLHSDLTLDDGNWKRIFCGINYELNDTQNNFTWWKTSLPECFPLKIGSELDQHSILNGIHYGIRNQSSIDNFTTMLLEEVKLTGPTLVRTDIPHLITYNSHNRIRKSLSIRFKETWNSWDGAVKAFAPLMQDLKIIDKYVKLRYT